jgi:hypothetical protein
LKTSFKVETTTTGYKVRAIIEKSNGKTTSRLIGRPRTYDEVDSLIEAYEMGVGHL